jgi:hypothetical protein
MRGRERDMEKAKKLARARGLELERPDPVCLL